MQTENLTLPETAEWLRLSTSTVKRMLKNRELPGVKIKGKWLFPKNWLEAWLKSQATSVMDPVLRDENVKPVIKNGYKKYLAQGYHPTLAYMRSLNDITEFEQFPENDDKILDIIHTERAKNKMQTVTAFNNKKETV